MSRAPWYHRADALCLAIRAATDALSTNIERVEVKNGMILCWTKRRCATFRIGHWQHYSEEGTPLLGSDGASVDLVAIDGVETTPRPGDRRREDRRPAPRRTEPPTPVVAEVAPPYAGSLPAWLRFATRPVHPSAVLLVFVLASLLIGAGRLLVR